jgi:hypothetical protein
MFEKLCNAIAIVSGLLAAILWFWSATVNVPDPKAFTIVVNPPVDLPTPSPDPLIGIGHSNSLQQWSEGLTSSIRRQSDLSAYAAVATGFSVLSQLLAAGLRMRRK